MSTDVVYHDAWTVINHDRSSVVKYNSVFLVYSTHWFTPYHIEFINENIAAKGGVNRWNDTFKAACMGEAKMFDTGLYPSGIPFHIIPDGTYFLHMSSAKSVVLAIEVVKNFSRSPLDKLRGYFPNNAESCIVARNQTGGQNERVRVEMDCFV
jgi:hypothetical protein